MKRFIIPAIIVVDMPSTGNVSHAKRIAAQVQSAANQVSNVDDSRRYVMLDEKLPTVEVPIPPGETKIPGTYPTPDLASLRERIQDNLLVYLDGMPNHMQVQVCQIVVDSFKEIS